METKNKPFSMFLVDDDKMFLLSLMHQLDKEFGTQIEITNFTNGEDCLDKLYLNPNIIILDYYLNSENPKALNGIQVLKKIKLENTEVTVIMLSAQDKLEIAADSIKYGAFEYVVKSPSAFIRSENIIKNILFSKDIEKKNKVYEKWNYILATILLLTLLFDVIFYNSH